MPIGGEPAMLRALEGNCVRQGFQMQMSAHARRHRKPEEVDGEQCSVCNGAVGQLGNQAKIGGAVARRFRF